MASMLTSFFSRDPLQGFSFELGEKLFENRDRCLWTGHQGKRKGGAEPATQFTVFIVDLKEISSTEADVARCTVKRLKTLKHPHILTYVDSVETDKVMWLVTEEAEPLEEYLRQLQKNGSAEQKQLVISWGIYQITNAVQFLCSDAKLTHNNINMTSVYVTKSGEWKLFGLDYVTNEGTDSRQLAKLRDLERYAPPEHRSGGGSANRAANEPWSIDMWGLACLIWEAFNGILPVTNALKSPKNIPKNLHQQYASLISGNPNKRPSPVDFLQACRKAQGFMRNKFVDTLLFLEEFQLKEPRERTAFFGHLKEELDIFPESIAKYKILPRLIQAYEFGEGGSAVLSPMFKLGKLLSESEYQTVIVPCVVKLFGSSDRATRVKLLERTEELVVHLNPTVVNDKIFPNVVTGFLDTNPAVRESTVKAFIHLAPKLNYQNLNVELMKHFARLQARDGECGIRTNTTVCLGKVAGHLNPSNRQKILISAFIRATKDSFPPARVAGVLALSATQQYYQLSEISTKIVPSLSLLMTDPEKQVRDQSFKAIRGFMEKLEKASENPELIPELESQVLAGSGTGILSSENVPQWANWALGALSGRFYKSTTPPVAGTGAKSESANINDSNLKTSSMSVHEETASVEEDGWGELDDDGDNVEEMDKISGPGGDRTAKRDMPREKLPSWDEDDMDDDDDKPWEGWDDANVVEQSASKITSSTKPPQQTSKPLSATSGGMKLGSSSNTQTKNKAAPEDALLEDLLGSDWSNKLGVSTNLNQTKREKEKGSPLKGKFEVQESGNGWDGGWNENDDFQDEKVSNRKKHSASEKNEQKRLEMQQKRQNRQISGSLKLGARKL